MENASTKAIKNEKVEDQADGSMETVDVEAQPSPPPMLPVHGLQSMFDTIDYLIVQDGYQCAACPGERRQAYQNMPALRRHMVKHVNGGRASGGKSELRCNHCNRTFERIDLLRKHLLEALNKEYGGGPNVTAEGGEDEEGAAAAPVIYIVKDGCLTCSVCNAEFGAVTRWNKEKFKKHVGMMHWKNPEFKCDECGIMFHKADGLEKHMMRHAESLEVGWMGTEPSTSSGSKLEHQEDPIDTKVPTEDLHDPMDSFESQEIALPEVQIKIEPDEEEGSDESNSSSSRSSSSKSSSSSSSSDSDSDSEYERAKRKRKCTSKARNKKPVKAPCRKVPGEQDGSIILACNLCDEGFLVQELLDRHMAQKHDDRDRPFRCKDCGKTYMTNGNLQEHIRMVHSGIKFPCKVCGIELSTKSSWKRHMKGHTEEGFSCDICKEKFSSHSVLAKHKRRVHEKVAKNFICLECGSTYDSNAALREHRISHTNERRWECEQCGMKFKRNHNLMNHRKTHLVEKPVPTFKCKECDEEFTTKGALTAHRPVHGKVCCRICKRAFDSQSELMQHRKDDHQLFKLPGIECRTCSLRFPNSDELLQHRRATHPDDNSMQCNICNASFATPAALSNHQRGHQRVTLYNCPNCTETFNSQLLLDTHLKTVHSDAKNHVCDLCGKGFPTRKQLASHLMRHRRPQKQHHSNLPGHYICDICGKEFNFRITLKRHVFNIHTNESRFQCTECDKVLVSAEGLKLHLRSHSEDQMVVCDLCGHSFTQPYRLRVHMARHAREGNELSCHICKRVCRDPKKLELHIKSHIGETEYSCAPCQRHFATNRLYRLHMKRMHESEATCPVCDKLFPTEAKMKNHFRIHDNPHMFECPKCFTCIKDKKHLDRHLRQHKNDGIRIPCRYCPQKFAMMKTLRCHMSKMHKDEQKVLVGHEMLVDEDQGPGPAIGNHDSMEGLMADQREDEVSVG